MSSLCHEAESELAPSDNFFHLSILVCVLCVATELIIRETPAGSCLNFPWLCTWCWMVCFWYEISDQWPYLDHTYRILYYSCVYRHCLFYIFRGKMSCLYCWQGTGLEGYSTARDAVISNKAEMLINKIVAGCWLPELVRRLYACDSSSWPTSRRRLSSSPPPTRMNEWILTWWMGGMPTTSRTDWRWSQICV